MLKRHLNLHVYCSIFCYHQDMESIQVSVDEWIKKSWNIYTLGYYSAIKLFIIHMAETGGNYVRCKKHKKANTACSFLHVETEKLISKKYILNSGYQSLGREKGREGRIGRMVNSYRGSYG